MTGVKQLSAFWVTWEWQPPPTGTLSSYTVAPGIDHRQSHSCSAASSLKVVGVKGQSGRV